MRHHSNQKLNPHFYGPYRITQCIGEVVYAIDLPPGTKIHNVFHVFCLKKKLGQSSSLQTTLPLLSEEQLLTIPPDHIISSHQRRLWNRTITEHLVQWVGCEPKEATWESEDFVRGHPHLIRFEESASQRGGHVTHPPPP